MALGLGLPAPTPDRDRIHHLPWLDVLGLNRAAKRENVDDVRPRHLPAQHAVKIVVIAHGIAPYASELLRDDVIFPAVLAENGREQIVEIDAEGNALGALELRYDVVVAALLAERRSRARTALLARVRAHNLALRAIGEPDEPDWIGKPACRGE